MTPADLDSTLVRRGVFAHTFSEIATFADTVERRPLDKLLQELPALAALSDTKFSLARQIIRRRARELDDVDREQLRVLAEEVAPQAGVAADRIRSIFAGMA